MTGKAFRLVVGRCAFQRISGIKPGPAPTIPPELAVWVATNAVLYHDKPARKLICTAHRSSCHLIGGGMKHFLDQYCSVGEASIFTISLNSTRRGIDAMHLLGTWPLISGHCPTAQHLIGLLIVCRHAYAA